MTEMPSPEEIKANCIFCKIISGEIPSKKVFEDEQVIAILDINPANKGHVLIMPKEHYPILPLVPPDIFKHLFEITQKLMMAMKKALIVSKVTVFIANGGVAGQQSPHFIYHLIPRELDDGLDMLDIETYDVEQQNHQQALSQNMNIIMKSFLQRELQAKNPAAELAIKSNNNLIQNNRIRTKQNDGTQIKQDDKTQTKSINNLAQNNFNEGEQIVQTTTPEEVKTQLATLLETNPQLKQLIITNPQQVHDSVQNSPELKVLFEGIDIFSLSEKLKEQAGITKVIPLSEQKKVEENINNEQKINNKQKESETNIPKTNIEQPKTNIDLPNINIEKPEYQIKTSNFIDVPDAADLSYEELITFLDKKPKLKELLLNNIKSLHEMMDHNPRVKAFFKTESPEEVALRIEQKEVAFTEEDFKALEKHFK